MNLKFFSLSLFSLSALLTLAPSSTPSAYAGSAGCVEADVAAQVAVRGSQEPAKQNNNVDMQTAGECLGNTTTNTSTQLYVGSGSVDQTRNSNQVVGGSTGNGIGVDNPTIGVPVHVPVDVYSPAHDPNFLGNP